MLIEYREESLRFPDFLIVGAPRSGTSALYLYLAGHPQIFMPDEKEPMFFAAWKRPPYVDPRNPGGHLDWVVSDPMGYAAMFKAAGDEQILGEASTWYLSEHAYAISNMEMLYGERLADVKIIAILRNPAGRAWSHYQQKVSERQEHLDFDTAIAQDVVASRMAENYSPSFHYLQCSLYHAAVKAYRERFKKVRIYIYEEFFERLPESLDAVFEFLGVDGDVSRKDLGRVNVSGRPKGRLAETGLSLLYRPNPLKALVKPLIPRRSRVALKYALRNLLLEQQGLDSSRRLRLMECFREDIHRLERLLDRDLSIWERASDPGDRS